MAASYGSDVALFVSGAKQDAPLHPLRAALQGREIWARPRRYRQWRFSNRRHSRLINATLIFFGLIAGPALPLIGVLLMATQNDHETQATAFIARLCQVLPGDAAIVATNAGFCPAEIVTAAGAQ